mmetsp:Transcript_60980/g.145315  ORF Transcript_60980/g.145315 Transcript_60980/m.145315 type:complete len:282 (+) Transcript_60980:87-932(+)
MGDSSACRPLPDGSAEAALKEYSNLSVVSFPSSVLPSEELGEVLGDCGDLPTCDALLDAEGQPPPSTSQPWQMKEGGSSSSGAGASSQLKGQPGLGGLKVKQIFWFIGDNHPAAAGFKERRPPAIDSQAKDAAVCVGCHAGPGPDIYYPQEAQIPEADLSTVQFSTRQQRLDWRDFLCEIVATSQVSSLFTLFDVEADPPLYAKPPPSGLPLAGLSLSRGKFGHEELPVDKLSCGSDMSVGSVAQETSQDQPDLADKSTEQSPTTTTVPSTSCSPEPKRPL